MPVRYVNDICIDKRNVFVGSNRRQEVVMVLFPLVLDSAMDYKKSILIIGDLASWHDLGSFLQLKEPK